VMLFQAVMKFFLDQNLVYNANGPLYESFSWLISTVILRKGEFWGSFTKIFLYFWSSRTAFVPFSKANSQTNRIYIVCILQKWLSFHENNDFITQIVDENFKIKIWIFLHDMSFTVGGGLQTHIPSRRYILAYFWTQCIDLHSYATQAVGIYWLYRFALDFRSEEFTCKPSIKSHKPI
jgi:hypothetical protein